MSKTLFPESSINPFTMWEYSKKMPIYEIGSKASLGMKSASTLILNSSTYKTVRNKFLLFVNHTAYGNLLWWLELAKTLLQNIWKTFTRKRK
jgi:hypothetical protein